MSVRLDEAEMAEVLSHAHTGILATLRSDGSPAMMPLWFVVVDGAVCLRTMRKSAKVKHIQNDARVSFLVESGRAWAELKAVVLYGAAQIVESEELTAEIDDALASKYAEYGMPSGTPSRTREHYASKRAHIRITPNRAALTWNNAKLVKRDD